MRQNQRQPATSSTIALRAPLTIRIDEHDYPKAIDNYLTSSLDKRKRRRLSFWKRDKKSNKSKHLQIDSVIVEATAQDDQEAFAEDQALGFCVKLGQVMPHLTHVSLEDMVVTLSMLSTLLANGSRLKNLELEFCRIKNDTILIQTVPLNRVVQNHACLNTISLTSCEAMDENGNNINTDSVISKSSTKTDLLDDLIRALGAGRASRLILQEMEMSDQLCADLCFANNDDHSQQNQLFGNLSYLELSQMGGYNDTCITSMTQVLEFYPNPHLQTLKLQGSFLTQSACQRLALMLQRNSTLQKLSISGMDWATFGTPFAHALDQNTTLQSLEVVNLTTFQHSCAVHNLLRQQFVDFTKTTNQTLSCLSLSFPNLNEGLVRRAGTPPLTNLLFSNTALQQISLGPRVALSLEMEFYLNLNRQGIRTLLPLKHRKERRELLQQSWNHKTNSCEQRQWMETILKIHQRLQDDPNQLSMLFFVLVTNPGMMQHAHKEKIGKENNSGPVDSSRRRQKQLIKIKEKHGIFKGILRSY